MLLQLFYRLADGGLGDVQLPGCLCHALLIADGDEDLKMAQCHTACLLLCNYLSIRLSDFI